MTETLSSNVFGRSRNIPEGVIATKNVKEFIKQLKEELCTDNAEDCRINLCETKGGKDGWICRNCEKIDKLAGPKLTEEKSSKEDLKK